MIKKNLFLFSIIFSINADQGVIDKKLIARYLPKNPVIVEAGAHRGFDTEEMAKIWPCKIYAFEPVPDLYTSLISRCKHLSNVKCYQVALSDRIGQQEFFISSGTSDGSSSLFKPKEHLTEHPTVTFNSNIIVKTITLDEWATKEGVNHVDLLWLDMQGGEFSALNASPNIMKTVKVIFTEVSTKELYEGCPLYLDFKNWLEGQGFSVVREDMPWPDGGNVLFVRFTQ